MTTGEPAPVHARRHPPFGAGNRVGEVHGGRSEPRVAVRAAEIEQAARADPSWPSYLDDAGYASAVASWARAEAIVSLMWGWLVEHADPTEALASTLDSTTVTEGGDGESTSRTRSRRTGSVLDQLHRWEGAAARQRQRLGLDPLSRARLGRDVAQTVDLASYLSDLREREDAQRAGARPEITGDGRASDGEGDGPGGVS